MADDAIGLLDNLNIKKAHVCGISMGGMIAQVISYRHPSRVLSLISIMSGTGKKGLPIPKPEVIRIFHREPPNDRKGYIDHMLTLMRSIYGSGFKFHEKEQREKFEKCYNRSYHPSGFTRHYLAILVNGDRTESLNSLKIPALIIHGRDDPLVRIEHGIQTAEAIQDSELLIIDGMGHSLPPEIHEKIVNAILKLTSKI